MEKSALVAAFLELESHDNMIIDHVNEITKQLNAITAQVVKLTVQLAALTKESDSSAVPKECTCRNNVEL